MKVPLRLLAVVSVIALIIVVSLITQTTVNAYSSGAPIKVTGSPGDGANCTSCHIGTVKLASGLITSTIPTQGYMPGQTYTVTATCVSASVSKFGFEISPQNVTGALRGTMIRTDVTRTQLIGSGKYITHTSSGTSGVGYITWSFNWTAPVAGTGNVTFYGAFNYSNSNGSSTGDTIKLSQLAVSENTGAGVAFISEKEQITLWPNPVQDVAHISFPSLLSNGVGRDASLRIFDLSGKIIREVNADAENIEVNLANVVSGVYFVSLSTPQGSYSYKLYKL